jgi:hypothetical protein
MSSLISQNYARRSAASRQQSGTGTERSQREPRKNPIKALDQATCFVENALWISGTPARASQGSWWHSPKFWARLRNFGELSASYVDHTNTTFGKGFGCPSWVINGPAAFEIRLPFYSQERTFRNHHLCERQLCADIVEKVENRATPKISQKLILRHIDGCNAPQR